LNVVLPLYTITPCHSWASCNAEVMFVREALWNNRADSSDGQFIVWSR
jgi:hypothetical protein